MRIARELHDVVAHSMSIIAVQSGVGVHVLDSQPEEARKALVAVEATSRQALVEMRRLLGVLRQEHEPRGSLTPAPGLAEVEALAAVVATAGVRVEVRIEGTPSVLPAGLDLSVYRIIQEALTNVVRHAGPATARVSIRHGDGQVAVEVVDDGKGVDRQEHGASASPGCGSGRPLRRHPGGGRCPAAASGSRPRCRWRRHRRDDQGPGGRRPDPGPGRVPVLVESAPDLEVVGEAGDGVEAVALAGRSCPTWS